MTYSVEKDNLRLFPLVHVNNVASVVFDWNANRVILNLHSTEGRQAGEILQSYNITF